MQGSHSVWRASCRGQGGPAFQLGAGSGLGLTGAALASAATASRSCAWPHLRKRTEERLQPARLDRFALVAGIVSCVGGTLKFFKKAYVAAAFSIVRGSPGRACRLRRVRYDKTWTPNGRIRRLLCGWTLGAGDKSSCKTEQETAVQVS